MLQLLPICEEEREIQRGQLSQLPDDPRVVLDPNTDCSSAAPSPAEPRESKPGPHHGELGKASARSQAITAQLDGRRFVTRPVIGPGAPEAGRAAR